jgi:hypothetical protein
MDWKAIFQSIFSRAVWELLLIIGGGAVIGIIKNKWPDYAPRVLYGAAGSACVAVLLFTLTGRAILSNPLPPETTPDNIQDNVKLWSENLGLAFIKASIPDSYFAYTITTSNGIQIQVMRSTKEKTLYLEMIATLALSPDNQATLGTLTKDQIASFTDEIAVELNKSRVGFALGVNTLPQTGSATTAQTLLVLQKGVPINGLTELGFSECTDDINFTAQLVKADTSLILRRMTAGKARLASTRTVTQN